MNLLRRHNWRKSWDQIIPGKFSGGNYTDLLFYDRKAGQGEIYSSDGSGNITLLQRHNWRKWASPGIPDTFDRCEDDIGGVRWREDGSMRSSSVRR
jgi:hypothetical protein